MKAETRKTYEVEYLHELATIAGVLTVSRRTVRLLADDLEEATSASSYYRKGYETLGEIREVQP